MSCTAKMLLLLALLVNGCGGLDECRSLHVNMLPQQGNAYTGLPAASCDGTPTPMITHTSG